MNYRFNNTVDGIITDKKVEAAVAKLDKLDARGTLIIEVVHDKEQGSFNCKITGTGLKQAVLTKGKKAGDAVHDGIKRVATILRNDRQTIKDKREQARRKANMVREEEEQSL